MFQLDEMSVARQAAERLVGDPHPLTTRLGSPAWAGEGLPALAKRLPPVVDRASLERFLTWYHQELLVPLELPAIRQAWERWARFEPRELIELDLTLASDPRMRPFAAASRAVGRSQLRRLLPMRDQRLVRRYYEAVELGRANGWHILVYGVVLGLFSIPLRQGLLNYARQTTSGFIERAAGPLKLRVRDCDALLDHATSQLPPSISGVLDEHRPPTLLICR